MGKDIYFRKTGEKAISRADKRADRDEIRQRVDKNVVQRKNISKKDSDVLRKVKMHKRQERMMDQRQEMAQNATLQKFNEGKMGKLSFQEKRSALLK